MVPLASSETSSAPSLSTATPTGRPQTSESLITNPVTATDLTGVGGMNHFLLAEPSGKYVYVANQTDGTISAYSLNNSTGALTAIGTATASAAGTNALSYSSDGKYLYATNGTEGTVTFFTINANGSLTGAGTATAGTLPSSMATTGTNQ